MMALPYSAVPPGASVQPTPFRVDIPEESLSDLKSLVKCARVAHATYENSNTKEDEYHGVSRQWMLDAKDLWMRKGGFDWYELFTPPSRRHSIAATSTVDNGANDESVVC